MTSPVEESFTDTSKFNPFQSPQYRRVLWFSGALLVASGTLWFVASFLLSWTNPSRSGLGGLAPQCLILVLISGPRRLYYYTQGIKAVWSTAWMLFGLAWLITVSTVMVIAGRTD